MNDLVIVMMPPYPKYETAPEDQPNSELWDCPKCNKKCWLSGKKKGLLMFHSCAGDDIFLACYDCITKKAQEDPSFFTNSEMRKL
jgi:hypothetical protein